MKGSHMSIATASMRAGDGSFKDVPGLIPGDANERAGSIHVMAGLENVDHQTFHEQGEAAVRLRPRNHDLYRFVLRALGPWDEGMDDCVELAGVEMPPLSLGGMVVAGQFTATLRAVPAAAFGMLDLVVDLGCLEMKSRIHHLPRSGQAEKLLVEEFRIEHVPRLRGKDGSSLRSYPQKSPRDRAG